MTAPQTDAPRWFAVDSDHDITLNTVLFSLDQITWAAGTHGDPIQDVMDQAELANPIQPGRIRYWYYIFIGPGQQLEPTAFGKAVVHGRVEDDPSQYYLKWEVYFRYE